MLPFVVENSFIPYGDLINKLFFFIGFLQILFSEKKISLEIGPLLFLLLAIVLTLLSTGVTATTFKNLVNLTYQVLICEIVYLVSIREKRINFWFDIIVINSLILAVCAIIEYLLYGGRVRTYFYNPNYLAIYLAFGAVTLIQKKHSKNFFGSILISVAVIFTSSFSIFAAIIITFVFKMTEKLVRSKLVLSIIFLSIVIIEIFIVLYTVDLLPDFWLTKIWDTLLEKKDSERVYIWKAAISIFSEHPLIGIGYGNFLSTMYMYTDYSRPLLFGGFVSHNDYLRVLSELGAIGFLSFLYLLFSQIKKIILSSNTIQKRIILSYFLVIILFIFAHNYLSNSYFWVILVFPSLLNMKKSYVKSVDDTNYNH